MVIIAGCDHGDLIVNGEMGIFHNQDLIKLCKP
jgi:hypothetical protein